MANRTSPPPPPPPPPRWQQVIARREAVPPPAEEARVLEIPEDRLEDPRERVEWFARMPDHAKEEIRKRWRAQEGVRGEEKARRKETSHLWIAEGAVLFVLAEILLMKPARPDLLWAGLAGAAIGALAARAKPGPVPAGILFAAAYLAFGAFAGTRHFAYYILAVPIILCSAAALALAHRVQRFDGSEM